MSKVLENLKYTKTHEWVKVEGNVAYIGITDFAQESLGNIVYLEVNEIGDTVEQFGDCGVIESVKAASDLQSPVSGEIIDVNEEAVDEPERLNEDAFDTWILKVEMSDLSELDSLLSPEEYKAELK